MLKCSSQTEKVCVFTSVDGAKIPAAVWGQQVLMTVVMLHQHTPLWWHRTIHCVYFYYKSHENDTRSVQDNHTHTSTHIRWVCHMLIFFLLMWESDYWGSLILSVMTGSMFSNFYWPSCFGFEMLCEANTTVCITFCDVTWEAELDLESGSLTGIYKRNWSNWDKWSLLLFFHSGCECLLFFNIFTHTALTLHFEIRASSTCQFYFNLYRYVCLCGGTTVNGKKIAF